MPIMISMRTTTIIIIIYQFEHVCRRGDYHHHQCRGQDADKQ